MDLRAPPLTHEEAEGHYIISRHCHIDPCLTPALLSYHPGESDLCHLAVRQACKCKSGFACTRGCDASHKNHTCTFVVLAAADSGAGAGTVRPRRRRAHTWHWLLTLYILLCAVVSHPKPDTERRAPWTSMLTRVALPIRQAVGGILAILIIICCIGVFVVLSKQRKKKVRRHTVLSYYARARFVCTQCAAGVASCDRAQLLPVKRASSLPRHPPAVGQAVQGLCGGNSEPKLQ